MQTDRLWIAYDLTFATPFHFGTGIRKGLVDRTLIRDDDDLLYVPGSTLKGVLRERCEQLTCFYEGENPLAGAAPILLRGPAGAGKQQPADGRTHLRLAEQAGPPFL